MDNSVERALMGAILLGGERAREILKNTEEKDWEGEFKEIFSVCKSLIDEGVAYDPLIIKERLGEGKYHALGGHAFFSSLLCSAGESFDVGSYIRQLRVGRIKREILNEIKSFSESESPERIRSILRKAGFGFDKQLGSISRIVESTLREFDSHKPPDLRFYISDLDKYTGCIRRKTLYTIGARTSHGKTAFAVNVIAKNLMQNKDCKVLMNVAENYEQTPIRIAALMGGIPLSYYVRPDLLLQEEKAKARAALDGLNRFSDRLFVFQSLSMRDLRKAVEEVKPDIIVLDYLQRMVYYDGMADEGRLSLEIGKAVAAMQDIAIENNSAFFCLSQVRRSNKSDGLSAPDIHDLKESGDIENCSDVVIMLYWPWKENQEADRKSYTFFIRKNKMGDTGIVSARIDPNTLAIS